ncbi:colicin V synthesis protein [Pantoea sp. ARC607]|uniref:colicin V synthesis protein n=1 Tax=unclassified Pantoea TaxID=2630326 RepID=UPI000DA9C7E1|nr:colicin V synthesis protein [Pantoea sp. ARC607]PZL99010.1 colicin V synthesis protein [Pantoea sp. ARC607]
MRELNVMEINEVSGAGFWSAVSSAILLGATGFAAGAAYGGIHGGDQGGLLGVGVVGQLVGVIVGPIIGVIGGSILGAVLGWNDPDSVNAIATQFLNNFVNGNFK